MSAADMPTDAPSDGDADAPPAYPPVDRLMPHGPPIRALEALLDWAPGRAVCKMTIRQGMPFVRDGRVSSACILEYMAQAVAVCLGYEAYVGGEGVRVGMLVGVRKMELLHPFVEVGRILRLDVERVRGSEDVSTFSGNARTGDVLVATAQMTLYHAAAPPDGAPTG